MLASCWRRRKCLHLALKKDGAAVFFSVVLFSFVLFSFVFSHSPCFVISLPVDWLNIGRISVC